MGSFVKYKPLHPPWGNSGSGGQDGGRLEPGSYTSACYRPQGDLENTWPSLASSEVSWNCKGSSLLKFPEEKERGKEGLRDGGREGGRKLFTKLLMSKRFYFADWQQQDYFDSQ